MSEQREIFDQAVLDRLRSMARQGQSPCEMLRNLKQSVDVDTHIVILLNYFRQAFGLILADVKPIAALSRNEKRELEDEDLLDRLLTPAILKHRTEWEASETG